ncbi:MAG: chemotaxis response regulator protein-glutamate methylesterase [Chlamydiota bacterium]|nr:chemotaxis response regulator protein-glutamate methylesterase [Chlamydiota bacterium]
MKIGIVNDIPLTVKILDDYLYKHTNHEVVWRAFNGVEAVELCARETPDLVLMDLIMPEMDGVESTRLIMKNSPCAILIVTSSVKGNLSMVYQAMGHGALDVVKTPTIQVEGDIESTHDLLKKINTIQTLLGYKSKSISTKVIASENKKSIKKAIVPPMLAMGASTGGPMAVAEILSQIPLGIPFAITIIQHIDEEFTLGLAKWLSSHTPLPVVVAKEGVVAEPGHVYLSGYNKHLLVNEDCSFHYSEKPLSNPYKPSVDLFFSSLANNWSNDVIGVILTGMGCDGASGLKELRDMGNYTIAEDQTTCVIYGMPKVAVKIGAAESILPLDNIGPAVMERFERKKSCTVKGGA